MSNVRDPLDEIIEKLEQDREEINKRKEQLSKIEAKRYEMSLEDEQDSSSKKVIQDVKDPLDELIKELEQDEYQFEENAQSEEQPVEVNVKEEIEETKEQDKEDRER